MNNIKATFADTRGHARRGSQKPPRPIGPRATPICGASGIRRQTRQTAFPIHTAFHTLQNVRNGSRPMAAGRIWRRQSTARTLTDIVLSKTPS